MAIQTFERVKPKLFAHEGGYSGDRHDPGNWSSGKAGKGRLIGTKYGIAAPTLIANRDYYVTADHMRVLTRADAIAIYKAQYWDTVRGDDLPAGVDYCVYDYSVNSGPGRASRELQRVVGVPVDGVIGPQTLNAVRRCGKPLSTIIDEICDRRLAFMKRLRVWPRYKNGWSRRVSEVRSYSKKLLSASPAADYAPQEDVPVPRAKAEDVKPTEALKKPQTWLQTIIGGGGLGLLTQLDSGPIQWAIAIAIVGAVAVGVFYAIKSAREAD
ncbi:MAG: glycoside hydrolase family 108 protein [Roseibium sp.]|nr:glycoside hydrolase family 108 protein [Roseibium sp.]